MSNSVYSFADLNGTITCPGFISIPLTGAAVGTGDISIEPRGDNTSVDRSADSHYMFSKIPDDLCDITISVHQTSPLNSTLTKLYNFLRATPSVAWNSIAINFDTVLGLPEIVNCSSVCFMKRAGKMYQAEGQSYTWSFVGVVKYVL